MIRKLDDPSRAAHLFEGWDETLIRACLQQVMGEVYATDPEAPASAMAYLGCFAFYAGKPDRELVLALPGDFVILTPQNDEWARLIEECFPDAEKSVRYAIKKGTEFDVPRLRQLADRLPDGYELKRIDGELYDRCLEDPMFADFVSSFKDKESFLKLGRGVAVLKDGKIVSGASSYARYREGIELEVDTAEQERRKGLATAACAALILDCLEEGLVPGWDAQNLISVRLAEKLGYELDHEYIVYEASRENQDMEETYITLRERPELMDRAAEWFHEKWGVPKEAYLECMSDYLDGKTEYGWYLCLEGERIVGGMGVIENDFHDRKDLFPNVCAVYVEEDRRCRGIAGRLLDLTVEDLRSKGISPVYLLTDHTGFYERYGWEFYCMAQGDGEEQMSRMYVHR